MSFERSTLKSLFVDVNLSLLFSLRHDRSGIPSFTTVRCISSCDPVAKFSYVLLKQCHCEFFHDSWCKNILFLLRLTCLHYTSVSIDNCAQVRFKPMTGIWECMECYIHRIIVSRGDSTNSTMIALRWASVLVVNSGTRLFWLGHESNGAHYFVSFHASETVNDSWKKNPKYFDVRFAVS